MTEKEAIEVLLKNVPKCCKMVDSGYKGGVDDWDCDMGQAIRIAVFALQEIQQYRDLGTIEKIKLWIDLFGLDCFDELAVYRKIGTVEECREAVEKQKPKKVNNRKVLRLFDGRPYCIQGDCPVCGRCKNESNYTDYCPACGQKFDWRNASAQEL